LGKGLRETGKGSGGEKSRRKGRTEILTPEKKEGKKWGPKKR